MTALEAAAVGSLVWAIAGLVASAIAAWRRGTPRVVAAPAGSSLSGVMYAFGPGMSPWAKESAREHPFIYVGGVLYHLGVAAAALTLASVLGAVTIGPTVRVALAVTILGSAAAGAWLLVRRATSPLLRAISVPDDYASNVLVDAWLATGAVAVLLPSVTTPFLALTILLGLYAPLGKIRHCVFFFLARARFGARLGRRGGVGPRREVHV